jgi:septum formation protein
VGEARPIILLASRSPRRKRLLAEHDVAFEIVEAGVDDAHLRPGGIDPGSWAVALAYLKAQSALAQLDEPPLGAVVLGADTICIQGDDTGAARIIGQPADEDEARAILRLFQDRAHAVITGVALICAETGIRDLFLDRATVRVGHLGDGRIEAYVASGLWRGKAGGYNLEERLGAGWPLEFEGDRTTIVGLPMTLLLERLGRFQRMEPRDASCEQGDVGAA